MKTVDVRTAADWQAWLAQHHESESEVCLIFHKRHSGQTSIDYSDALDWWRFFRAISSTVARKLKGMPQ